MSNKSTTSSNRSGARQLPPQARGWPLLGPWPQLLRRQVDFLQDAHTSYGDIYTLNLGLIKIIMLNHPELADYILREHAGNYTKGGPFWDLARKQFGNGLGTSEGEFWLRQRRLMQPQFHHQRLRALSELMLDSINESLPAWEQAASNGQPLNVERPFMHMTLHALLRTMFGTELRKDEADEELFEAMNYLVDYNLRGMLTSRLPAWMPAPGARRYQQAIATRDKRVFAALERRRREGGEANDLISMLMHMVDAETNAQMTDQQLRDEAVSLFLAGYETAATMLTWTYHMLTQAPHLAQRLQAEVDEVLGQRLPTFDDLHHLSYTRRLLQESLRLYPPAYFVPRTAVEDDTIDGYHIPAGAFVAASIHAIHRHPDYWPNPNQCDPDRFTPEQSAGRHRLAWMPFGAGQRFCIANEFALMEGQFILARLAQRFELSAVAGRVARTRFSAMTRTRDGVWVKVALRR